MQCAYNGNVCFRLESYDRNENFVNDPVILPPTLLPNWPTNGFWQILHSHREMLPPVLEGHVTGYFMYRVASDNMANSDIAASQKGRALLASDRVETCSFCTINNEVFFSGIDESLLKMNC